MISTDELVKLHNTLRRASAGRWYSYAIDVDGNPLSVKAYDTWIQRAEYLGFKDGGPNDALVKDQNAWLARFVTDAQARRAPETAAS